MAAAPREVEIEARLVEFDPAAKVYRATGGVSLPAVISSCRRIPSSITKKPISSRRSKGLNSRPPTGSWEGESLVYSFRDGGGKLTAFSGQTVSHISTGETGELRGEEILVKGPFYPM